MDEHDLSWVRTEMALAQPAPRSQVGAAAWVRKNLFATPIDSTLTIIAALAVAYFLPMILNWMVFSAQWTGADRTACLTQAQGGAHPDGWSGACWAFVNAKFGQFMYGTYPFELRWRPKLVYLLAIAALVPLMFNGLRDKLRVVFRQFPLNIHPQAPKACWAWVRGTVRAASWPRPTSTRT